MTKPKCHTFCSYIYISWWLERHTVHAAVHESQNKTIREFKMKMKVKDKIQ